MTVEEAYAAPLGSNPDRPWCALSMVASIDGSTVVSGVSGGLGDETDRSIFLRLRALADVIIVGSATVRAENYGPPSKPGQRIGVVTARGNVDTDSELFTSGAGFLIASEAADLGGADGIDTIRVGRTQVDLARAVTRLEELLGPTATVQVEGGGRLNGAALDAGILDELNITTAPVAVGGGGPRLAAGAAEGVHGFELAQIAVDDQSYVFSRWVRRRSG